MSTKTAPHIHEELLRTATLFEGDLPPDVFSAVSNANLISWDIETSGLNWKTDQIGLCQLYVPPDRVLLVKINSTRPENLIRLLSAKNIQKIFHHAPFDLRFMCHNWKVRANKVACTKIASRILNPYENDHSLQALLWRHLGLRIEKTTVRRSDWVTHSELTREQMLYAITDVVYLPELLGTLQKTMTPSKQQMLAGCFEFLPYEVELEMEGNTAVFAY
jgi:ribonuclease D